MLVDGRSPIGYTVGPIYTTRKRALVLAGNLLLVLTDTIYRIQKIKYFLYQLLPVDTNNEYIGIDCVR
jgi:hypothetical protein